MQFILTIEGDEDEIGPFLKARKQSAFIFELTHNLLRSFRKGHYPEHINKMIGDDPEKEKLASEIFDCIDTLIMNEIREMEEE